MKSQPFAFGAPPLGRRPPLIERLAAGVALALLSPALLAIAVAIVLESGRPALFRQTRVGLCGSLFQICKFRSMRQGSTGSAITAARDSRTTRVGAVLRRFKLDELPQLWNVVRGEMRFVGPRPELPKFVDLQNSAWQRVLSASPGITDLATLLYRNEEAVLRDSANVEERYANTVLPDKLRFSLTYLEIRNWRTDLKLIGLTLLASFVPWTFSEPKVLRSLSLPGKAT
ncbi:MAG TPA: sugar transferase [Bryobacteraceae bacterium]|nr:sugar transferase [Bryobacteraceae bacterium]